MLDLIIYEGVSPTFIQKAQSYVWQTFPTAFKPCLSGSKWLRCVEKSRYQTSYPLFYLNDFFTGN